MAPPLPRGTLPIQGGLCVETATLRLCVIPVIDLGPAPPAGPFSYLKAASRGRSAGIADEGGSGELV